MNERLRHIVKTSNQNVNILPEFGEKINETNLISRNFNLFSFKKLEEGMHITL